VLLLVNECEKELGPLPDLEQNENQHTKPVIYDTKEESEFQKEEPVVRLVEASYDDSIVSVFKRNKRERYRSDLTNATRSGLHNHEPIHKNLALMMGHCNSSPLAHDDSFNRFFNCEFPNVKVDDTKVSATFWIAYNVNSIVIQPLHN
jgi:hypothetical protein